MIYAIFGQYMKYKMQIMQERPEYDLLTNFMQQTTSPLSESDSIVFVTNTYRSPPTWQIVWKLKQVLKTSIAGTKTKHNTRSQTFTSFIGVSFINEYNDYLLQPMVHVNRPLLQFAGITDPLLSTVALFSGFYVKCIFWDTM